MNSIRKIPFRRRIQTRISVTLIIVTTILLAGYGAYQYLTTRAISLSRLNALADSIIARLAENMIEPLWNMQDMQIRKVALSEMGEKHVASIHVNDQDERLLLWKGRDAQWQIIDMQEAMTGDAIVRRQSVGKDGKPLGVIELTLTKQFMHADLRQAIRSLAVTILIIDAVLLVVVTLIARKVVIQPLASLLTIANAVAAGDFSHDMRVKRYDEIGALASAFGEMHAKISQMLDDLRLLSQGIQEGVLTTRGQVECLTGGWRDLVVGINQVLESFVIPITQIDRTLERIAQGDFTETVIADYRGDFGKIMQQVRAMTTTLTDVVVNVKTTAQDVAQRSREMSAVAEQMSEGASQQAAATEEISASMEQMAANIRQTADNAKLAESMAATSAADSRAGKQAVTEIIEAMNVIAERISVIQEIASQTNMLSLNATIEASKAQDYGKGFSVVASSVRDLARQTRDAADEIRRLVHSSVTLSAQAGEVLQRLVPNSEKTAELVQEICAASQEQANGVQHVNEAVQQLDLVTQHNAATAEEVASTAESLTTQADALQTTMAFFTVHETLPVSQTPDKDLQQRVQELEQQLAELRGAARPQPTNPSAARDWAIDLRNPNAAGDERDREFERY